MANRYRPTTLRLASQHCPRAIDFYDARHPAFADHFAAGIAAHAVLEALGRAAKTAAREEALTDAGRLYLADAVTEQLLTTGRTFDGVAEPPLSIDAVYEGRDLALRWAKDNPMSPTARYELGAGFDRDWALVGYDAPDTRFRLIFDVLDTCEDGDEEGMSSGIVCRDYKTSWSTDESELDTLQMRAQAVAAWLMAPNTTPLGTPVIDFVRQEVVNLRTRQIFVRTIYLCTGEGEGILRGWQRDLTQAMDALDAMQPTWWQRGDETSTAPGPRPARPGTGCMGCPFLGACDDAQAFLAAVLTDVAVIDPNVSFGATREDIAAAYAVAEAQLEQLGQLARNATDDGGIVLNGRHIVGTVAREVREPREDAGGLLLDEWTGAGGDARGLLKAMRPGVGSITSAAKTLCKHKEARELLIARLTTTKTRRLFGVHDLKDEKETTQ